MEDNGLPFGMLASFKGDWSSSSKRRYLGMKGAINRFNRELIPQTGTVFFLKQYLPSLIALDIQYEEGLVNENTADIAKRIEAFCCWRRLILGKKDGNDIQSKLIKGKTTLSQGGFLNEKYLRSVPDAKDLGKKYNKTTFSQSCGVSLKELGLTTKSWVNNADITPVGKKVLSSYFENSEEENLIKRALQNWLNNDSSELNTLLNSDGALKALDFDEDVQDRTKEIFKEIIDSEIIKWFENISAEEDFLPCPFEKFKKLAPTDNLRKQAEKVQSFFIFFKSCLFLADLMERELDYSDGVNFEDFSKIYRKSIEITKEFAKDFLKKNTGEIRCALALDIFNTENDQILRTIMECNERKGLTFEISHDGILPIKNNPFLEENREEEDEDEEEMEPSPGNYEPGSCAEYLKNLNNFILIPQVFAFYKLQLPWSLKDDGFEQVKTGIATKKFWDEKQKGETDAKKNSLN